MSASRATSDQGRATRSQWFIGLVAFLFVCSLWAFHSRWDRPFTSSPIDLPEIPYTFTQHSDLLLFDQATQAKWNAMIHPNWWDMKWTDTSSGEVVTRGVDMLHKIHCLVALREEFTTLANNPNRYLKFQAEDHSSSDMRLHLGHCFDFLRQVRFPTLLLVVGKHEVLS